MIFYFSATGNTRWAAETLARRLDERLVSMADAVHGDCRFALKTGERVGFAFPVHGWRPPLLVRAFVRKLTLTPDTTPGGDGAGAGGRPYAYCLVTAGDDTGLAVDEYFDKCVAGNDSLARLGIGHVDAAFSLIMPESYVGLPFMDVDPPARERDKKSRAAEELGKMAGIVERRMRGVRMLKRGAAPWTKSHVLGACFEKMLVTDRPFHVETRRCTACGACARACPVGNVACEPGHPPAWRHNGECLACFACYHHCPSHAIEYGRRTKHKGQYFFKPWRKAGKKE